MFVCFKQIIYINFFIMKEYKSNYDYKAESYVICDEVFELLENLDGKSFKECFMKISDYGLNGYCTDDDNEEIKGILEKALPLIEDERRKYAKKLERQSDYEEFERLMKLIDKENDDFLMFPSALIGHMDVKCNSFLGSLLILTNNGKREWVTISNKNLKILTKMSENAADNCLDVFASAGIVEFKVNSSKSKSYKINFNKFSELEKLSEKELDDLNLNVPKPLKKTFSWENK